MKFHPFAEVWPLLEGPKFDKLVADIKAHGLHYPITTYQGMIIDGRNRFRACIEAGIKPRFEQSKAKNDHDALVLSASLNEHRRHLSEAELAFVASKLANLESGYNARYSNAAISKDRAAPENNVISIEEAAKAVGVSAISVHRARAVQKHAPELEKEVKAKKLSLTAAAAEATARKRAKTVAKKTVAEIKEAQAKERAAKPLRAPLTKRDVDPEFHGTDHQFVTEYGHVWTQTSQERSTARFMAWSIAMGFLVKTMKGQKLPKVNDVVVSWLRKPKQVDIERMEAALAELEEAVAIARRLLDRAKDVQAAKVA